MLNTIKQILYQNYISKKLKISFGNKVKINRKCVFEGNNALYNNTIFTDSNIGFASYIANNSIIRKTKIGRFCTIGDNVRTCLGLHPTKNFVSIHPAFFSLQKQAGFTFVNKQLFEEHKYIDAEKKYVVEIGNDVWIGNNVMIMDGVKINDGAVIATGAIVTKNVPSYAIVGGIPAKIIKKRFSEEQVIALLEIRWWDWDIKKIREKAILFKNINAFLDVIL